MKSPIQRIVSPHNPRLKQAVKLRQRRSRDRQDRILIDGLREIRLAIAAGVRLDEVFVDERRLDDPILHGWLMQCSAEGSQIFALPPMLLAKVGYAARQDQCVATARTPQASLASLQLPSRALIIVLEGVEKPGNLGAVARCADAVGADALVIADGGTDLYNPNAIRASRGTLFTVPLFAAAAADVVKWLEQQPLQVCVARVDAELPYDRCDFRTGAALVLGSEAQGVTAVWRSDRFTGIQLPMFGQADSLNVAATAAVLLYEANRQRRL